MLTGMFDLTSVKNNYELAQQCRNLGAGAVTVKTCHILNESTMVGVDPTGISEESAVTNKVCPVTVFRALRRPHHSHLLSRETVLPLL